MLESAWVFYQQIFLQGGHMTLALALNIEEARSRPYAYRGYDQKIGGWKILQPANPHAHLRNPRSQPDIFELAVRESANLYNWVIAMPNLGDDRIRMPDQAINYRQICRFHGQQYNPDFYVTVPLYLEPDTDPKVVRAGYRAGAWKCAKLYPQNGTTGSAEGVDFRNISAIFPALKVMEELGMRLLVHGESVLDEHDCLIADRRREPTAIRVINEILQKFPKLHLVFEHISSRSAVIAIRRWQKFGYRVEATVAPQYLVWNSTVLYQGGINPARYSIPILKDERDRLALIQFVIEGGGMLGTDSAPHDVKNKSKAEGCPGGVFNEPVGLFVYFHIFRTYGGPDWFKKFVRFSSTKAREFYDEPAAKRWVVITETEWEVQGLYQNGSASVIPMFAGMTIPYSCKAI